MPKYKIKKEVKRAKGGVFVKDEIVERTPSATMQDYVEIIRKNDYDNKNLLILDFELEKVDDSTPITTPSTATTNSTKGGTTDSKSSDTKLRVISTIGALGGIYLAYTQKKGFWGYIGFMIIGGIAGSLVANGISKLKK